MFYVDGGFTLFHPVLARHNSLPSLSGNTIEEKQGGFLKSLCLDGEWHPIGRFGRKFDFEGMI